MLLLKARQLKLVEPLAMEPGADCKRAAKTPPLDDLELQAPGRWAKERPAAYKFASEDWELQAALRPAKEQLAACGASTPLPLPASKGAAGAAVP